MNTAFKLLLFFVITSLQISCLAKKADKKDITSNTVQLAKEDQHLIFTEVWVWEYKNEWIEEGESGYEGEVAIYFNREKNYWLFTSEAYGVSGEMTDWVIGKPNGEYISKSTDEFGHKSIHKDSIIFHNYDNLSEYLIPLGASMSYGNPEMGFPLIQGNKYKVEYLKTNDSTTLYLGETIVDMRPVYYFNQLISEAKLPMFFMTELPNNKIILSDFTISSGHHINLEFKYISHTEYHIELP